MSSKIDAEKVSLKAFSVCLLDVMKNTGLKEFKIFTGNRGIDYNSFYVLDLNNKNVIVNKKQPGFNKKFIKFFDKLSDFNDKSLDDQLILEGLKEIEKFIMHSKDKGFVYRKLLVDKWQLNKKETFLSIYNNDKEFFFKFILPVFWKFIDKKTLSFFPRRLAR